MKFIPFVLLVIFSSCISDKKTAEDDATAIEQEIVNFHLALKRVYNGVPLNTDSLMNSFFDNDVYYVTYWGITEPVDSTKARLRNAVSKVKNYESRLESVNAKVYGDGAYAFFILRQTYSLNGILMDEYLPTTYVFERKGDRWKVVHSQRSADFQTTQHLIEIAQQREETIRQDIK